MKPVSRTPRLFCLPQLARSRRGSLAVFFCIVLAALVLVLNSWLQAARMRACEAELTQAMAAQIDVTLASYQRDLLDQFGLFAFTAAASDRSVFQNSLSPALRSCPLTIDWQDRLTGPAILDGQIVRQMKTRLPGAWTDLVIRRFAGLPAVLSAVPSAATALRESDPDQAAVERPQQPDRPGYLTAGTSGRPGSLGELFEEAFQSLAASAVRKAANRLFGSLLADFEEDLLQDIQKQYQQFAAERLSVGDDSLVTSLFGGLPDFFNPDSLTGMAASLDRMLNFSTPPVYEKLCVVEYILAYFTQQATSQVIDGSRSDLLTPDGRSLAVLSGQRPREVEQILTGIGQPALAAGTVRFILICLRSLIHLAAILTDETRMAAIRGTAAAIVGAVAAISLGTVVVEPESVAYLIVAAQALAGGIRESSRLIQGTGVRFWPGKGNITFQLWYADYVRLMLYCLPRATLVARCGRQLERLYDEPLYTRLSVRTTLAGRDYVLEGGYDG